MSLFPKLKIFHNKKKAKPLNQKVLDTALSEALEPYVKLDDVKEYLRKIQKDERKRRIWDNLSNQKKLRLLRYLASKKEKQNVKG